ncbi:MAG: hypothetical protein HRT77_05235 [Halioglobus sp.]|nr:hypothetical protein [Halioglobus sp.]
MKVYLARLTQALLFFVVCVGAFNWWSDPYGIWGPIDVERLNRNQQVFFLRLSKPFQIARIKPTAAIIGSSRSGPIDPQNPAWRGETPYNLSLHGLTVYEMKRFIEHAIAQGTLRKLLIAIEFDTFIPLWPRTGVGYAEGRLLHAEAQTLSLDSLVQRFSDLRNTLLTSSTLALSIQSWVGKAPADRAMQGDGSWRLNTQNIGKKGFVHSGKLLKKRSDKEQWGIERNLQIFSETLVLCHLHGIDTRLYLSPEHLFMTDFRQYIGYGEERDNFIRAIIALNEEVAISTESEPFPIWGFDHIEGISDQALPEGDAVVPMWFRDGFHFYGKLGDIILEQVWDTSDGQGYRLDSGSVDSYLTEVEQLRARFIQREHEQVLVYRSEILGEE